MTEIRYDTLLKGMRAIADAVAHYGPPDLLEPRVTSVLHPETPRDADQDLSVFVPILLLPPSAIADAKRQLEKRALSPEGVLVARAIEAIRIGKRIRYSGDGTYILQHLPLLDIQATTDNTFWASAMLMQANLPPVPVTESPEVHKVRDAYFSISVTESNQGCVKGLVSLSNIDNLRSDYNSPRQNEHSKSHKPNAPVFDFWADEYSYGDWRKSRLPLHKRGSIWLNHRDGRNHPYRTVDWPLSIRNKSWSEQMVRLLLHDKLLLASEEYQKDIITENDRSPKEHITLLQDTFRPKPRRNSRESFDNFKKEMDKKYPYFILSQEKGMPVYGISASLNYMLIRIHSFVSIK